METIILVESRKVYGLYNMYVISDHAKAIEALTGKKTINLADIKALKELGFTVRTNEIKPIIY